MYIVGPNAPTIDIIKIVKRIIKIYFKFGILVVVKF